MNWTGITNENEFYSTYFLSEGLMPALEERLSRWKEQEEQFRRESRAGTSGAARRPTPAGRLAALAAGWNRAWQENLEETDRAREWRTAARHLTERLLLALDLPCEPGAVPRIQRCGPENLPLPLLGELRDSSAETDGPALWILEAMPPGADIEGHERGKALERDVLSWHVDPTQWASVPADLTPRRSEKLTGSEWLRLLERDVFDGRVPPRRVLLVGPSQWVLMDRFKFGRRSVLRFSWKDLFVKSSGDALRAAAALLSRSSFEAQEGRVLLDHVDEEAHKQATGVSASLRRSLREAIELLGNAAAKTILEERRRQKKLSADLYTPEFADQLTKQCLRYMYRLLFLLFAESRPELQYVPRHSRAWDTACSFESLRALELTPLLTEEDRNGTYLSRSVRRLFEWFSKGTPGPARSSDGSELDLRSSEEDESSAAEAFVIHPLLGSLFDPRGTDLLNGIDFPNDVMQKIIRLLSLSQTRGTGRGGGTRTGRISYAHLGINQLGAVYEALLACRGFFAKEDLYEVRAPGASSDDDLGTGYFVTKSELVNYDEKQHVMVKGEDGELRLKKYPKETFIYRLTGRERETSASYYTPEELTKLVVRWTLREWTETVLEKLPSDRARAEKILSVRICEPAMGSAAFLNEAVSQLAVLYMDYARRAELDEQGDHAPKALPQEKYAEELQNVKMHLVDNCVYGVDLNPQAVELGEVSLWLNALSKNSCVPWFGEQLLSGNSLLGCRRSVYSKKDLLENWTDAVPYDIGSRPLAPGEIWHFLVPNPKMSAWDGKELRTLFPKPLEDLKNRRRKFLARPADATLSAVLETMDSLSQLIEGYWRQYAAKLGEVRAKTALHSAFYGHRPEDGAELSYEEKRSALLELQKKGTAGLSPLYERLTTVMNSWCSLWFWPLDESEKFPESLLQWLLDLQDILGSQVLQSGNSPAAPAPLPGVTGSLGLEAELKNGNLSGLTEDEEGNLGNVEYFESLHPALAVSRRVADRLRFFHWPLRFADLFVTDKPEDAGFDLTFGNPPWRTVSFNTADVLGDFNPKLLFKKTSAPVVQRQLLEKNEKGNRLFDRQPDLARAWLCEFEETMGTAAFLQSEKMYPELIGGRSNIFRNFLPLAWRNAAPNGCQGFVHPKTTFTETKAVRMRRDSYRRLRYLFQFTNEEGLFDIHHAVQYCCAVYGPEHEPRFRALMNLYHPQTVDASFATGTDEIMTVKDSEGRWNRTGSRDRVLDIDAATLREIGEFLDDDPEAPEMLSLPSRRLWEICRKVSALGHRLRDLGESAYRIDHIWNETTSCQNGTISDFPKNATQPPSSPKGIILNGPHIGIANPLNKTPDNPCPNNLSWECIDLARIPDDFLPRMKYRQACPDVQYQEKQQKCPWDGLPFADHWKLAYREMVGCETERSLTAAVFPPESAHVHSVQSLVFKEEKELLATAASFSSIILDAYVRVIGKAHLLPSLVSGIPRVIFGPRESAAFARILRLNCLTSHYADLWNRSFRENFLSDRWTQELPGGNLDWARGLTEQWTRGCALRSDLYRRQALLELDVLTAQALGLSLEDLLTLYRYGFRILRSYEENTWYDQNGRIVCTPSASLVGTGIPARRKASDFKAGTSYCLNGQEIGEQGLGFEQDGLAEMKEGEYVEKTFLDATMTDVPVEVTVRYEAPFFRMDREKDYERAWAEFERRFDVPRAAQEHGV